MPLKELNLENIMAEWKAATSKKELALTMEAWAMEHHGKALTVQLVQELVKSIDRNEDRIVLDTVMWDIYSKRDGLYVFPMAVVFEEYDWVIDPDAVKYLVQRALEDAAHWDGVTEGELVKACNLWARALNSIKMLGIEDLCCD